MQTPQTTPARRKRLDRLIQLVTGRFEKATDAELRTIEQRLTQSAPVTELVDAESGRRVRVMTGGGVGRVLRGADHQAMLDRITGDSDSTDWAQSELKGAGDVAQALDVARSTVDNWRRARRVIAFEKGVRNFVFPMAQFDKAKPVAGIAAVSAQFDDAGDAWEWLVLRNRMTGDAPPLEWLRGNRVEEVVSAARGRFDFA